ncbi:PTS galactitol transporter subunit IIC [Paenactinomyces guangxiensis]|uniref:PTS galactitol transporter subunit IIC n=1 Tax=Paenactinomyces guangxiensis TaxID=1490290 RepID=A0A7W1WUM2_9BACL|nr:PTS galactitol transporter subunit IIC [Paenactinomyces guangxiensis]MBA4496359.1 PTS galactitol transporter subunit IIC [Paenactinomyces guangxiensis]MBH8593608.1 PTS galactitol transporter subunit IIC [Paenactinomyces guangxiensis]
MQFIQYVLDLGPSVMLPVVIIILSLILRQSFGKAVRSGIMIGVGFVGINLVIGLLLDNLGPAAKDMAQNFGVSLQVVDIGWPGASPMAWASHVGSLAIPIAVAVNVVMLIVGWTRVVNIDIWNIWHMTFTGAMLQIATGSWTIGLIGVAIHAAIVYKLGDWFAPVVERYFGLEGVAIPHGTSAYLGPLAVPIDWLIEKIPGLKKINFNAEKVEEKLGVLGEPMIIGGVLGIVIGFLAGYETKSVLQLGIQMAAVMVLMPRVVKCIMEGLIPVAEAAKSLLEKKFSGKKFYIGLDPALLLGDSQVVAASLLFVPLTIIIAMIVPGNKVLPFGDLATIGFFVAMAVGIHKGNLFRTLISGFVIMFMTLWISTQTIGLHTQLAKVTGAGGASQVASLDQGGSPITYILIQIFEQTNIPGLLVIGLIYAACLVFTYLYYKKQKAQNVETDA